MGSAIEERSTLLKEWALELGFDRAGVAPLGTAETGLAFRQWLERGDHADMEYMARSVDLRCDPSRAFEGARSALCVALVYSPLGENTRPSNDLWGGVAKYAGGRDYHNLMGKKLRKLAKRIRQSFPGTETRHYVDTGPVLERELGAAAGLGAVGKNTLLLHPEGSYFFIGEILTSLELSPDSAMGDLCGTCTLCLEACPTDALPEPYRLDSRRCISYWTIEHRGEIPQGVASGFGEWSFGCDICQEVCPHNGLATMTQPREDATHSDLHVRPELASLGLRDLLTIGEERYQEIFRGNAMKRAKREGLRRNAAIAMGNSGNAAYIESLRAVAGDDDPVLRVHAKASIARLQEQNAAAADHGMSPSEAG